MGFSGAAGSRWDLLPPRCAIGVRNLAPWFQSRSPGRHGSRLQARKDRRTCTCIAGIVIVIFAHAVVQKWKLGAPTHHDCHSSGSHSMDCVVGVHVHDDGRFFGAYFGSSLERGRLWIVNRSKKFCEWNDYCTLIYDDDDDGLLLFCFVPVQYLWMYEKISHVKNDLPIKFATSPFVGSRRSSNANARDLARTLFELNNKQRVQEDPRTYALTHLSSNCSKEMMAILFFQNFMSRSTTEK